MTISLPTCQWPDTLEEHGPVEDPSILLKGILRVGAATLQIVAIRINPELRRVPAYRPDVEKAAYVRGGLSEMLEDALDELEGFAEMLELSRKEVSRFVELETGFYKLCIVPVSAES